MKPTRTTVLIILAVCAVLVVCAVQFSCGTIDGGRRDVRTAPPSIVFIAAPADAGKPGKERATLLKF